MHVQVLCIHRNRDVKHLLPNIISIHLNACALLWNHALPNSILLPDLDESKLSPLRSGVVNTKALAQIARDLKLGEYLRIGKGEESSGGRDKNSILADALEAVVGAIYLAEGFNKTAEIILKWFRPMIASANELGFGLDAKTALQELAAARGLSAPDYEIEESGPDHDKSFTAAAIISGEKFGIGHGKSKREAEQVAAKLAYEEINSRP